MVPIITKFVQNVERILKLKISQNNENVDEILIKMCKTVQSYLKMSLKNV